MVLVDSSIWIEASRRAGRLEVKVGLEGLLEEYEALLCPPVRLEVLGGARREERHKLAYFFDCLPYREMPDSAWQETIHLAWQLADLGFRIPWNDLLIGTLARLWNMRVYALDTHFEILKEQAGVKLYQPGYGGLFQPD
jgi:predicted nucleic acid-binding protein